MPDRDTLTNWQNALRESQRLRHERDALAAELAAARERYDLMVGEARKVNRAWKQVSDELAAARGENQRREEQAKLDAECAAVLSSAVGQARLRLRQGRPKSALAYLDEASQKTRALIDAGFRSRLAASAPEEPHCDYCGWLAWTLDSQRYDHRVTHKHVCPHRTDPFCQSHPGECPAPEEEGDA